MGIISLSDIRINRNLNGYWRREYYEAPADVNAVPTTSAPGTLISTSYTVTLTETSRIRVVAKAVAIAADTNTNYNARMAIYEGAGGVTQRDLSAATCLRNGSDYRSNTLWCLYEGFKSPGSYVFEVRGWANVASKVNFAYIKWYIDVCKA